MPAHRLPPITPIIDRNFPNHQKAHAYASAIDTALAFLTENLQQNEANGIADALKEVSTQYLLIHGDDHEPYPNPRR